MSDFIFTPVKMKKKNFYGWLKSTMISAGWTNISSRPVTDNDVMFSTGESGEENILFRMKEFYTTGSTNTITESTDIYLSTYPLRSYKPGNSGLAGVAEPSFTTGKFIWGRIARSNLHQETDMTVYYHCNKDRIVFVVEWPEHTNSDSNFFMFGKPTRVLAKKPTTTPTVTLQGYSYSTLAMVSDIADVDTGDTAFVVTFAQLDTIRSVSSSKGFIMSEIEILHGVDGIHSIVDGIYAIGKDLTIQYNRVLTGDELKDDDGNIYRLASLIAAHSSYPAVTHPLIAFRIR